ncbi:MAG: hypothetical protein ACYTDU_20360 [Planctomycetota bacterium]
MVANWVWLMSRAKPPGFCIAPPYRQPPPLQVERSCSWSVFSHARSRGFMRSLPWMRGAFACSASIRNVIS